MSGNLSPPPVFQGIGQGGVILVGGQLGTFQAGTNTPQVTYADRALSQPNTNPVILNANGQASIWLDPTLSYKFVLSDSNSNPVYSQDNIAGTQSIPNVVIGPPAAGVTALVVNGSSTGDTMDINTPNNGTVIQVRNAGTNLGPMVIANNASVFNSPCLLISQNSTVGGAGEALILNGGGVGTNNAAPLTVFGGSATLGPNSVFLSHDGHTLYVQIDGNGALIIGGFAVTGHGAGTLTTSAGIFAGGPIGMNGVTPPAQVIGWGIPTGPAITANFSGAAATLPQTSAVVAEIITALKNFGLFGA